MGVNRQKTKYNNKEVTVKIRYYVLKYIQNLDVVLTELRRAGITIARVNSQFCQANIKIVGYICDVDGHEHNTSKVLKILDWPECININ